MAYIVSSGGISSGIILENDSMTALDGGIAIGTTVNSRGILNVSSGGTADSTTVNADGSMHVRSGGVADSTTVNDGGYLRISSGGTATAIVEDGGYVYVANGATVSFVEHTFSGCVLSRTSATVHSGTTAIDVIWANKGANFLFGDAGNDRIVGASGNDVLVGGSGNDRMHGGGDDIFTFCDDWGTDIVEQLADGRVTLWFKDGSPENWDESTLTYTDGENTVKVSGVGADRIELLFADTGSDTAAMFEQLSAAAAFDGFSSREIFDKRSADFLASL